MAVNQKITELTATTTLTADDLLPVVDDPGGTPATKKITWLNVIVQMFASRFAADAGSNDTYVATLSPAPAAYITGEHYRFKANTANTGACTINFNGLGAKAIKKAAGGITTDLADNDIRAGQWVDLVYDGTNMQMQSLLGALVQRWTINFTDNGDAYIAADVAMTIDVGVAAIGTGTLAYEKSTAGAPGTFSSTTLPATLEAGAWLKVSVSSISGFKAVELKRTA